MSRKSCSKCRVEFECCNEQSGCWCESVSLDKATLAGLRDKFDNCLCPECLKGFEQAPSHTASA